MRSVVSRVLTIGIAVTTCPVAETLASVQPSFQGLGYLPGCQQVFVTALSGDGQVVVGYWTCPGNVGYFWTEQTGLYTFGVFEQTGAEACALSFDGSVAVGHDMPAPIGGGRAFRWTPALGTEVEYLVSGANQSDAVAVSADGSVIIGNVITLDEWHPFVWRNEVIQHLGHPPGQSGPPRTYAVAASGDGQRVFCNSEIALLPQPCVWSQERGMQPLGFAGWAYAASADGYTVVGELCLNPGESGNKAYRWTADTGPVYLGDLAGGWVSSIATDVSADGSVVVGGSVVGTYWAHGFDFEIWNVFIWDETHGMRRLQDLLTNEYGLDLSGWTLWNDARISDDGLTIAGTGINPDGEYEAWIARLPEPVTALLLAVGAMCMLMRSRGCRLDQTP